MPIFWKELQQEREREGGKRGGSEGGRERGREKGREGRRERGREEKREYENETDELIGLFPRWPQSLELDKPKTGPEALSGSLMCVAGAQTCGLCFSVFPRPMAGSWTVVEPVPTWDASAAGGSCARCILTPVPCFNFYQHVASSS